MIVEYTSKNFRSSVETVEGHIILKVFLWTPNQYVYIPVYIQYVYITNMDIYLYISR